MMTLQLATLHLLAVPRDVEANVRSCGLAHHSSFWLRETLAGRERKNPASNLTVLGSPDWAGLIRKKRQDMETLC